MDTRFIFSAMAGVFFVVLIFATITTVRHFSNVPISASRGSSPNKPSVLGKSATAAFNQSEADTTGGQVRSKGQ
jgi:hypothetical protein